MAASVRGTRWASRVGAVCRFTAALDTHLVERRIGRPGLMRALRVRFGECQRLSSSERVPMVTMRLGLGLLQVGLTVLIIEADTSAAFSCYYGSLQSFS